MTKKNLKPQQAAPVQREINTTSSVGGTGLTPLSVYPHLILLRATMRSNPFDSNTHLKKCQKSFSVSLGARLASMN
jgi:prenylated cyclic peptide (anacyclamide/piricyclamide family)